MWQGINPTERELDKFIAKWTERVVTAIRTVENRARANKNLPPLDPERRILFAGFKNGPGQNIRLLNFRTWMLRYGVSIEFQIEALRNAWPKRYRLIPLSNFYLVTLKPQRLATITARKHIERAVRESYPGGEQWTTLSRPPLPRATADAIEERKRHPLRNYRKPELDWRRKVSNENQ